MNCPQSGRLAFAAERQTRGFVFLTLLSSFLFFWNLSGRDLWASHEARAAQNAQSILSGESWALPRLFDDQIEMQKPPGYYWLVAILGWLRGGTVDTWCVLFPAAASGVLTVLLVHYFLCKQGHPQAGLLAGTLLATAMHFIGMARVGRIDMVLTCTTTLFLIVNFERPRIWAGGGLLAWALLLKGLIGFVLPLAVLCLVRRSASNALPSVLRTLDCAPDDAKSNVRRADEDGIRRRSVERESLGLRFVRLSLMAILGILLALPWFLWANAETKGEFFQTFFWYHHFQRALGGATGLASHPWWFYFLRIMIDFLPWTPLLFLAHSRKNWREGSLSRFGLLWFGVMFLLLSASRFKRADYLLPAYPGLAIFLGLAVENWLRVSSEPTRKWLIRILIAGVILSSSSMVIYDHLVTPKEGAVREQHHFATEIREAAPAPQTILFFRVESHLLAWHVGKPIHTLVEWGELNEILLAEEISYLVTREEFVGECHQHVTSRKLEVIARSADFSSSTPLRPLVLMRTVPKSTLENPACPTAVPKD